MTKSCDLQALQSLAHGAFTIAFSRRISEGVLRSIASPNPRLENSIGSTSGRLRCLRSLSRQIWYTKKVVKVTDCRRCQQNAVQETPVFVKQFTCKASLSLMLRIGQIPQTPRSNIPADPPNSASTLRRQTRRPVCRVRG